jgi:hypothetical protein
MSPSKPALSAVSALAAASLVSLAGSASAETRYDLSLHLGGAIGSVHEVAQAGSSTPGLPGASGDDTLINTRGTLGAAFELQLFDQGDGLPRVFLMGGATVFLGNRVDNSFATLHSTAAGAGKDTGITISRPFTVDLAIGGVFPLCRKPGCVELKPSVGLGIARRGITAWTDESADGGKYESTSSHAFEAFPFLQALVDVPLCKTCSGRPTRLRLGLVLRSQSATATTLTTDTQRSYAIGVDNHVELEPVVGLVFPL